LNRVLVYVSMVAALVGLYYPASAYILHIVIKL